MLRGAQDARADSSEGIEPGGGVARRVAAGLDYVRVFTTAGRDPFDEVVWEKRDAVISNDRGDAVFEQRDVEVPKAGRSRRPTSSSRSTFAARAARPNGKRASGSSSGAWSRR